MHACAGLLTGTRTRRPQPQVATTVANQKNLKWIFVKRKPLLSKFHDIRRTIENTGATIPSSISIKGPFASYRQDCILLRVETNRIGWTFTGVPHQYFKKIVVGMVGFDDESRVLVKMHIEVAERIWIDHNHGELARSLERRNAPDKIEKNLRANVGRVEVQQL
jgi:hypothetical protein